MPAPLHPEVQSKPEVPVALFVTTSKQESPASPRSAHWSKILEARLQAAESHPARRSSAAPAWNPRPPAPAPDSSSPSTPIPAAVPSPSALTNNRTVFGPGWNTVTPRHGGQSYRKPVFDFAGTKAVAVRVGREPHHKDFTVHENMLTSSPYLMNMLRGISPYISLPDEKYTIFNLYVQWLYSGRLYTQMPAKEPSAMPNEPIEHGEWMTLVDTYLLGYKLGDIGFQDAAVDRMLDWLAEIVNIHASPLLDSVAQIYAYTAEDNPLCRLVTDAVALKFSDGAIQAMKKDRRASQLPPAFLLDLVTVLSTKASASGFGHCVLIAPEQRQCCHYHSHAEGECYRK